MDYQADKPIVVEEWMPLKGYEEYYEISSLGKIKRLPYIMKCNLTYDGYPSITLCGGGIQTNRTIHRMVAEHFISNPENKPQVNHKDGNKQNCAKSNLEWNTESENCLHAVRTGLRGIDYQKGERNPNSKLTKEEVLDIREKCKTMKATQVRKEYYDKVSYNTISRIKNNSLWKEI